MNKKVIGVFLLSLFVMSELVVYLSSSSGSIASQNSDKIPNDVIVGAKIVFYQVNNTLFDGTNYDKYERGNNNLTITWFLLPKSSAKYNPTFNESVYLPEWYKEGLKKIAKNSITYMDVAINVKKYIMEVAPHGSNATLFYAMKNMSTVIDGYYCIPDKETENKIINLIFEKKYPLVLYASPILYSKSLQYLGIKTRYVYGLVGYYDNNNPTWAPGFWEDYIALFSSYGLGISFGDKTIVEFYDPENGWVSVDPFWSFMGTTMPLNFYPVNITKHLRLYGATNNTFNLPGAKIVLTYSIQIAYKDLGDKKIIYTPESSIIVWNQNEVHYVPAGVAVVIPKDWHFTFEHYATKNFFPLKIEKKNCKIRVHNVPTIEYG